MFRPAYILLHLDGPTCIDVTVISPVLAAMPVNFRAGAAAPQAEESKYRKHFDDCKSAGYNFLGFALDAFGVLAPDASAFLFRLASLLETFHGLPSYLA